MFEVDISSMSPARFRSVLSPERFEAFEQGILRACELLAGRVVWNVNSTAPAVSAVADDPEGAQVLHDALALREDGLIQRVVGRSRVRAAA